MKNIIAFVLFFSCTAAVPADYTVAGADPDFSTMTLAIAAVGSADTLQLTGDITEGVVWNRPCAMIWMDEGAGFTWTWAGSGTRATLEIQSNVNQAATLKGLTIDCSSGAYNTIYCPTTGAAELLVFDHCTFKRTSTSAGSIFVADNANMTGAYTFKKCKLIGNANTTYGARFSTMTAVGGVTMVSSVMSNMSAGTAISMGQPSSNTVIYSVNNTIDGCAVGYASGAAATFVNTAFTNNTDDINLSNNAAPSQFTYCAFQEQTNTGTFGTGCIFGISGSQYVNRGGGNFHLLSTSSLINVGTTNTLGSPDLDGVARPVGSAYDIGAYEYVSSKKVYPPLWWFQRPR